MGGFSGIRVCVHKRAQEQEAKPPRTETGRQPKTPLRRSSGKTQGGAQTCRPSSQEDAEPSGLLPLAYLPSLHSPPRRQAACSPSSSALENERPITSTGCITTCVANQWTNHSGSGTNSDRLASAIITPQPPAASTSRRLSEEHLNVPTHVRSPRAPSLPSRAIRLRITRNIRLHLIESLGSTDFCYTARFKFLCFYNIIRQIKIKHQKQSYRAISEFSDKVTEAQVKEKFQHFAI